MRYAIISDIHSNEEALLTVLNHIRKRGIQDIICLGDVVGYGPKPIECVELIMENCEVCLKGNHDEGLVEGIYLFNPVAKRALEWSKDVILSAEESLRDKLWGFLQSLPLMYHQEDYAFVHGSPLDPTSDYILPGNIGMDIRKFEEMFENMDKVLFAGHTHMPCIITESLDVLSLPQIDYKYQLEGQKVIINVGSVGQPRDGDNRSCYVEVVDDIFFFHRVPYDCEKVCQEIIDNENLDDVLGKRLLNGK